MYKFVYEAPNMGYIRKGMTIAATWAWGVSVIVGMQIFQTRGIEAFAIWAVANSLTLALVGWLFSKVPASTVKLADIMPAWGKIPYVGITYLIQFFSVLVNVTAIKTAFGMLGIGGYWPLFSVAIFAGVFLWGFGHVVRGNVLKFALWMTLLVLLAVAIFGGSATVTHSAMPDIHWALYGALILFCAPILDQQMWQRRAAFGPGIRPFYLASGLFAAYMVLVGLATATGGTGVIVAVIVLLVAGSTLASALSAVSCFHSTIPWARAAMTLVFLGAVACTGLGLSVLQIWVLYGSLRIPFALGAFVAILLRRD